MNKNKLGQETAWSLYSAKLDKGYPSTTYVWVNPEKTIVYMRSIEPIGFMKPFSYDNFIGEDKSALTGMGFKKVNNHKMNDDQLSQGFLFF
jgi:hypothetical protein